MINTNLVQIKKFEERMQREQAQLSKYALKNIKEDYEPVLEKIQAIKERYKNVNSRYQYSESEWSNI